MSTWAEFYNEIRDPSWPECATEQDFANLPIHIQKECCEVFGYVPGSFKNKSKLVTKEFPIKTKTACQLKWTWSSLFLTTEETASCHRTNHHRFDTEIFDFHNTPTKLLDRKNMLAGRWPTSGCDYCKNVEDANGVSDRITNLNLTGIHAPIELETDPAAIIVTPRILEVYFDNTCNLKCIYCGPQFSSLWDAENQKYGLPAFTKSRNLEQNKQRLFDWLKINREQLTVFNFLGGEPLYQKELEECLDFFEQYPAPELKLQMFSNLNARFDFLVKVITRIRSLIDRGCIREFEITASLDCWGPEQEYVRFPLDLTVWQRNFEYLLREPWINLIVGSTITPLTIKTLPDLLAKINKWHNVKPIYHYQNSVNHPRYLYIDIFGDIFADDFLRALELKPVDTEEQQRSRNYLEGIYRQSISKPPNTKEIAQLFNFLNTNDQRRGTNWQQTFPWLVDEFAKYNLK